MGKDQILDTITIIFKEVLDDESVVLNFDTTANDVEGWDSLTHIQLVVAIERYYKIRFTSKEIQGWNNIGNLIDCIQLKVA